MKNPLEMLKEIKSVLGIELSEDSKEETKLAQMTLENGTVIEAEEFVADADVFIVTEEDKIALPVGEYMLEDGMILVVESEGIIKEIKEATDEVVEEEVEASEVQETEDLKEEEKEDLGYATKEELSEVKAMIEEIKAMIKDKEEMAAEVEEVEKKVKEELSSTPAAAPLKHNPEAENKTKKMVLGQNRPQSTRDLVFAKIANIRK